MAFEMRAHGRLARALCAAHVMLSPHFELNCLGFAHQFNWPLGVNRTVGKALVRARQPGFGFNRSDVARRQLEPQLQDLLS